MIQLHQLLVRPVEVVCDEGHLLVELFDRRGPYTPPRVATLCWPLPLRGGRSATAPAVSGSEALNRSYRRCRNARSEAYRPSITPVCTSTSVPSLVITRESTITV